MPPPTLNYAGASNFTDNTTANNITGVSWSAGDRIIVPGLTEDNLQNLNAPTNANLTFTALTGLPTTTDSSCKAYGWTAVAASSQTNQTIALTSVNNIMAGGVVYVVPGSTSSGIGTPVTLVNTAKVVSLTRTQANSAVIYWAGDWSQNTDVTVDPDPAGGTVRIAATRTGSATMFVVDWGDQGAAGSTSYGVANASGTGTWTKVALEVFGTAGAAPEIIPFLAMAPYQGAS